MLFIVVMLLLMLLSVIVVVSNTAVVCFANQVVLCTDWVLCGTKVVSVRKEITGNAKTPIFSLKNSLKQATRSKCVKYQFVTDNVPRSLLSDKSCLFL